MRTRPLEADHSVCLLVGVGITFILEQEVQQGIPDGLEKKGAGVSVGGEKQNKIV